MLARFTRPVPASTRSTAHHDKGAIVDDFDFETAQRRYLRDRKAEQTVDARQWTGKPGSAWRAGDTDSRRPVYYGLIGRSRIYSTDDGLAYDVLTYNSRGEQIAHCAVKGLDAAFKRGEAQADAL